MTYGQSRMILWDYRAYPIHLVCAAVRFILAYSGSTPRDRLRACLVEDQL